MKTKHKVAASLTVYEISNMTQRGRKNICNWLRRLARDITAEPEAFSKRFRARYLYAPDGKLVEVKE